MLEKQYRLPAHVRLTHPASYSSPLFLVKVSPNNLSIPRFGFIVTKKMEKRAIARNRIKRVFRSCIEEMRDKIKVGYDMLFFLKSGVLEKDHENMYNEIYKTLQQKKLLQ